MGTVPSVDVNVVVLGVGAHQVGLEIEDEVPAGIVRVHHQLEDVVVARIIPRIPQAVVPHPVEVVEVVPVLDRHVDPVGARVVPGADPDIEILQVVVASLAAVVLDQVEGVLGIVLADQFPVAQVAVNGWQPVVGKLETRVHPGTDGRERVGHRPLAQLAGLRLVRNDQRKNERSQNLHVHAPHGIL